MNRATEQFFELVRVGLWDTQPNLDLFSGDINWEEILTITKQQVMQGVIQRGILKLPAEIQPDIQKSLKLHNHVTRNRQMYKYQSSKLKELFDEFKERGVEDVVLLKGLGVASLYPEPELRACGDFDIYIGGNQYKEAMNVLFDVCEEKPSKLSTEIHHNFKYKSVIVEAHHSVVSQTGVPYKGKEFIKYAKESLNSGDLVICRANEAEFNTPSYTFNIIYIFYHSLRHFFFGGVGVRQLCDIALFLKYNKEFIDKEELKNKLEYFRLYKFWTVFVSALVKYLGLPKEYAIFFSEKESENADKVMNRVLTTGNFGQYRTDINKKPKGYLSGKIYALKLHTMSLLDIYKIDSKFSAIIYFKYVFVGIIQSIQNFFYADKK